MSISNQGITSYIHTYWTFKLTLAKCNCFSSLIVSKAHNLTFSLLLSIYFQVVQINLQNGTILRQFHESSNPILSIVALPNQMFVLGRQDGICTVISLQEAHNAIRVYLTGSDCDGIRDISSNGKWIFTGCRDGLIRKYDFNQVNVHFK